MGFPDLLHWLESEDKYPKFFWKQRENRETIATLGSKHNYFSFPTLPNHFSERLYGGLSFFPYLGNSLWENFSNCLFFLPQLEVVEKDGQIKKRHPSMTLKSQEEDFLLEKETKHPPAPLQCIKRDDFPNYQTWKNQVDRALESIRKKILDKVVLARQSTFTFSNLLEPLHVLQRLQPFSSQATYFAYLPGPHRGFIGATPEKLFTRQNRLIFSEAIAGTRPRGQTLQEDLAFEEELKNSPKEQREFKTVKSFIRSTLSSLCLTYREKNETEIIKTPHLQHLHQKFEGTLYPTISDYDLISRLHPTPAVGGFPTPQALKMIQDMEPFERGWYAAPLGWISGNSAEFCVAIRSALILGNQIHLFAGTGIVEGSNAEKEWEELEYKISSYKNIFQ